MAGILATRAPMADVATMAAISTSAFHGSVRFPTVHFHADYEDSSVTAPLKVARTPAQILTPRGPLRRTPVRQAPQPVATAPVPSNVTASGNTVSTNEGATATTMGTISSGSVIGLYAGQRVCTN